MNARMPLRDVDKCRNKVSELRKWVRDGRDILGDMLGLLDIKATLAKWTKEEIDLLMTLEQRLQGADEDFQNAQIVQALPRWDSDKCSFKTVYMRWHTMVQELEDTRKRQLEESAEAERKRAAAAKWKRAKADADAAKQRAAAAVKRLKAAAEAEKQKTAAVAKKEAEAQAKGMATGEAPRAAPAAPAQDPVPAALSEGQGAPPPAEKSKIDANFAEMLNNDPYLQNQSDPQTLNDLVR
jgi:hypothetical protein